jgi:hypothetical protein
MDRFVALAACLIAQSACAAAFAAQSASAGSSADRVDAFVANAARTNELRPTDRCDDNAFLRRVTVDLIGRIPTAEEFDAFHRLPAAERRAAWVRRLLADARFADRWTVFYGDMFRIRSDAEGGQLLADFVRRSLADGKPYDTMVREMITGVGAPRGNPSVGFLTSDGADPFEMTGIASQVFMGVRLKCAQCHDHPFDSWTREDYYGLAAFFGKTTLYQRERPRVVMVTESPTSRVLWPPMAKDGETQKPMMPTWPFEMQPDTAPDGHIRAMLAKRAAAKAKKPTGPSVDDLIAAADRQLGTAAATVNATRKKDEAERLADAIDNDRRRVGRELARIPPSPDRERLAELVTHPRNRYFAWHLVNRVWSELFGRGFVEPVDDFRDDNRPSHPEVLDLLADEFIASGYDLRALLELITSTATYQRAALEGKQPDDRERAEELFAAARLRRMTAEVLYDSIVVAGHLGEFKYPAGANMKETKVVVATPKKTAAVPSLTADLAGDAMPEMAAKPKVIKPYSIEEAIEAERPLSAADEAMLALDRMEIESNEAIQARMMRPDAPEMEYDYETVTQRYDDNPRFDSSLRMASPAPPEHFLRQFGQPARVGLGEARDSASSVRQALILLNGRITNEAARVGPLEPIAALLEPTRPIEPAVRHAYIEILTRPPSAEELKAAVKVVESAENRESGVADLRWALLNCNEFRFLP